MPNQDVKEHTDMAERHVCTTSELAVSGRLLVAAFTPVNWLPVVCSLFGMECALMHRCVTADALWLCQVLTCCSFHMHASLAP